MRAGLCVLIGAICTFLAGRASASSDRDYVASGTLTIDSDSTDKQVCELHIGSATDSRKKLLLVSRGDMAFAQRCRDNQHNRATLIVRFSEDFQVARSKDGL